VRRMIVVGRWEMIMCRIAHSVARRGESRDNKPYVCAGSSLCGGRVTVIRVLVEALIQGGRRDLTSWQALAVQILLR
jgi:hypothetical protein